ncbi:MAG: glycosyltransferase family 4 protein [Lachnospiraceae bacterium]|nr:glycosyltransferase family 4 protein [Lachnospiraceae bacterium]
MRVLWICNQCVGQIAEKLNMPGSNKEGWLNGLFDALSAKDLQMDLGLCYPAEANYINIVDDHDVFAFEEDTAHPEIYDPKMEGRFAEIFEEFKPDIVHIFGTEYAHTLAAVKALKNPAKVVIGFQGVCNALAKEYLTGVDEEWISKNTFRDSLKSDNMEAQKKKFELRAKNESDAIALAGFVTGRTRLDREYTGKLNPDAKYMFLNETMRSIFYEDEWDAEDATKHGIFVSQCDYPIKGFHILIKALGILKDEYPDLSVRVAGNTITGVGGLKKKILIPTYGKYLNELMKEEGVQDMVHFLGPVSAEEMKKEYLSCSVFVLPSVMENSPNCLGEAMLLGVPSVASNVGGVPDIMSPECGILYDNNDPRLLADAVREVFRDLEEGGKVTKERTGKSRQSAREKHDKDTNVKRLLEMYQEIYQNREELERTE